MSSWKTQEKDFHLLNYKQATAREDVPSYKEPHWNWSFYKIKTKPDFIRLGISNQVSKKVFPRLWLNLPNGVTLKFKIVSSKFFFLPKVKCWQRRGYFWKHFHKCRRPFCIFYYILVLVTNFTKVLFDPFLFVADNNG